MIYFSDTINKDGLIQRIEDSCGYNDGDITGDATLFAKVTGKVNSALFEAFAVALKVRGWNVDDFNHLKDPFITIDLVSGKRDYHFTKDQNNNLILGIHKVMVANSNGVFSEIRPVDQQSDAPSSMWDGQNLTGIPTIYDKTGNGLYLDLIPNYSYANGLKVFIDREPMRFTVNDTDKIAGIDGLCHDYLWLKPSYEIARDKGLQNVERLHRDMLEARKMIEERYSNKEKDMRHIMRPRITNYR